MGSGVADILGGDILEGLTNTAAGGLDLAQETSGVVSRGGALGKLAGSGLAQVAKRAAPGLGAATALWGGAKDVAGSMSLNGKTLSIAPGQEEKFGVGSLKMMAGGLLATGAVTLNPAVLATGGALYGGTQIWENREALGDAAVAAYDTLNTSNPEFQGMELGVGA